MTTATIETRPLTYEEKRQALLAQGSPVRIFDQYTKFKAATEGRRISR